MFFVLTNGSLAIVAITFSRYIVAGVSEEALTLFGWFHGTGRSVLGPCCAKTLNFTEQFTGVNPLESDVDSDPLVKAVAIGCVAVLTIWNCFGTILLTQSHEIPPSSLHSLFGLSSQFY
jgi:hypothetical protein